MATKKNLFIILYSNNKGYVKYQQMGIGKHCPKGSEIGTAAECADALEWAEDLGIRGWEGSFNNLYEIDRSDFPFQCSYQAAGRLDFTFNTANTNDVPRFSNGDYKMICKKGKIDSHYELG